MIKYEVKTALEWIYFFREFGEYNIIDDDERKIFLETFNALIMVECYEGSLGLIIPFLKEKCVPEMVEENIKSKYQHTFRNLEEQRQLTREHISVVNNLIDKIYDKIKDIDNAERLLKEQKEIYLLKQKFFKDHEELLLKDIKIK